MAESYTFVYTDPQTGKEKRELRTRAHALTEAERRQLEGMGVKVAPSTQKEKILGTNRPDAKEAFTDLAEVVAYALLGAIPGGAPAAGAARIGAPALAKWLAAHPIIAANIVQSLGSAVIAGTGEAVKGKDLGEIARAAKNSGLVQATLGTVLPAATTVGSRLSGRLMRKQEDAIAGPLMQQIKDAVPPWQGLPTSHEGIRAIIRGEGQGPLSEFYGKALENVKGFIAPEERMVMDLDHAAALKLAEKEMQPILPTHLTTQDYKAMGGKAMVEPTQVSVPIYTVIDKLGKIGKNNPALYHRTVDAIDSALPEIASEGFAADRAIYREGKSFMGGLKEMHVFDEGSKRLNVERLSKASDHVDQHGKSVFERTVTGPKAQQILKGAVPKGPAPVAHEFKWPFVTTHGSMGFEGSGGKETVEAAMKELQSPSIAYSGNAPLTKTQEAVKKYLPGAAHALLKQGGVTP